MTAFLANKHILLGVTGSIAAYKSAELVRRLREVGAKVRVVMTENAKQFITPLTMQAVSGFPVHDSLFDVQAEAAMGHIELARWADAILIAPASADLMTRLANGNADDLLTTLCLASRAPIALAPAMNQVMWRHQLTQENLNALQKRGVQIFGPTEGSQACGDVGPGRMLEPASILEKLAGMFANGVLAGLKVLITAGPTHEAIDPIRFISNGSSGKMGYAMAEAAREAGAQVTLVSGPVSLKKPQGIEVFPVVSAKAMYDAVMEKVVDCDLFFAVAAVSDYAPAKIAPEKIHKKEHEITLTLKQNPDIVNSVAALAKKPFIVGFAAETENLIPQAKAKRERKHMDMIIANDVKQGFQMGSDENEVVLISARQEVTLPAMPKNKLARQLISIIADEFKRRK